MAFDWYKMIQEHGANKEAIRSLQAADKLRALDVTRLQASMSEARGGWKALVVVGTIAGTLGAILSRVFWH